MSEKAEFSMASPLMAWGNTMEAAQEMARDEIPAAAEECLPPVDAVVMAGDPTGGMSIEEMRRQAAAAITERELAEAFALAENKAWWVEDNEYDYEEGTPEHTDARRITDAWFAVADSLKERIFSVLRSEGVSIPERAQIKVLAPFMERNGFQDGRGWWVKEPCQGDRPCGTKRRQAR